MHLFLTGEKRVGKSTLMNAILAQYPQKPGGFRTVRLNTFLPGQYTVHLFSACGAQEPTRENLLFVCGQPDSGVMARFDRLGCQALAGSAGLLVMDELGPNESGAAAFRQAVWTAVQGDTPILGVLQRAQSPFLEKIARHPNVFVLEVTQENRDDLARRIPELVHILTKR